ncbi:MAG: hypothetical protein LAQ30_14040 [Acidobacteriia bacterium]|nr:hypothetical protein [Terriglobia bacterium]
MAQPGAPAPVRRGHGPLFWILMVVLGLFVLGMVTIGGFVWYVARDPGRALARIITAGNPNIEVVGTDKGARTITFRDRHTGKESTISFDDVRNGRIRFTAEDENGKTASVEIGETGKLPSWIPVYPGASQQGGITAKGDNGNEAGEGGMVAFTTSDSASKVLSFYQDKGKEMGQNVAINTTTPDGGMLVIGGEGESRSLTVIVGTESGKTSISLTYGAKR